MTTIYVRMPRSRLMRILSNIPRDAKNETTIVAKAGAAASRRIVRAFETKSRGGTDETGERWALLSPVTIAKRLRRLKPTTIRPSSNLTASQRELWWNFYRSALAKYHDKAIAARVAWAQVKKRGASPVFDKYGVYQHPPILKETGALLSSLQHGSSSKHRIFRLTSGKVELGSTRRGAAQHHRGIPGKLPQRRLWPNPRKWTSPWWQEILVDAREALKQLIITKLR